ADRLADDRVDLARHDRRAGLQVRDADLGQPGPRARAHQAQVVADLVERHCGGAQHSAGRDQPVPGPGRLEVVRGLGPRPAPCAARRAIRAAANPAGAFSPVPTAVPPSGSSPAWGSTPETRARSLRMAAAYPPNSCPRVTGTASIRCVRPLFT